MKYKVFFTCTTLIGLTVLIIIAAWLHMLKALGFFCILMIIWMLILLEDDIHTSDNDKTFKS